MERGKKILLIDDDAEIRLTLRLVLERAGYQVTVAPDGKEGLRRYHEEKVDLVITDIFMPEKEGLETIMEIRRESPATPIIAISGGWRIGSDEVLRIAERLGAIRTLSKPFSMEDLTSAMGELLSEAAEEREPLLSSSPMNDPDPTLAAGAGGRLSSCPARER
jgi:DNA-binding response OmpR family regulator